MKRCGKSAPRFRQWRRHGKPHREQDRIGTASRAVRESDNAAGLCQARRPGRLLEAMCKHGPRGMAVTYRPRKRAVPYRTRLTGWLIRSNEGLGATRRAPRHFGMLSRQRWALGSYSGTPALRRPSIISFEFDWPPRSIHADIVKAGSSSAIRAIASRASASRPRWAKAEARQR